MKNTDKYIQKRARKREPAGDSSDRGGKRGGDMFWWASVKRWRRVGSGTAGLSGACGHKDKTTIKRTRPRIKITRPQ
jgi:hypothetical protein